ncbi:MAG: Dam family site-specific DNA-(adenine-N6)-methyltransferase [Proteobacteria bacterium]|nr:Dam family site-specific DNA-(adenine-N6)-methyltransferase [Pseudomonadota bacterium]
MRPILKWAGGKARLASQITEAFGEPCTGTYYEPFIGGASVFLHRKAKGQIGDAVLSDVNEKLIELYKAIRDDVDGVLTELMRMPREDWRERYYEVRTAFNEGPWEGPRHAARFIWLNRAGFNGLYRENRKGEFNVPVGRYAKVGIPSPAQFRDIAQLLQGVDLRVASFEQVIEEASRGDQVYCDPPYVPLSATASFTAYCKSPFGFDAQVALADASRTAALRGATVVLSNHDLPLVRERIYPQANGFTVVARPAVTRAISRKKESRGRVFEVIAKIGPRAVAG